MHKYLTVISLVLVVSIVTMIVEPVWADSIQSWKNYQANRKPLLELFWFTFGVFGTFLFLYIINVLVYGEHRGNRKKKKK